MLARIRGHLDASPRVAAGDHKPLAPVESGALVDQLDTKELIDLFRGALESVNGNCSTVADETAAAARLEQLIELNQLQRLAVSDSPMVGRLMREIDGHGEVLWNAEPEALFECDAGITSAQWAIAETGTLVLESKSERSRLVSLIPPMHIAIVDAGRIRRTMSEALEAVGKAEELSRTVTFITGPSRTSDIELTLAIGVHGPGKLHVIVVANVDQTL